MKIILRFIAFILVFVILFALIFVAFPDQFGNAYQRVLVKQHDYLKSVKNQDKIVFIGASSLAFGYDIDVMENLTGKPCPVIGNNMSQGFRYLFEMVKPYIKSGDTVVIECAPEYEENNDGFELLITGIGKRFDMYRYFTKDMWKAAADVYLNYIEKNIKYFRSIEGYSPAAPYSADATNEKGAMTFFREECLLSEGYLNGNPDDNEEGRIYADFKGKLHHFKKDNLIYFNEFATYCKNKDINVYFTIAPIYEDVVVNLADYGTFFNTISDNLSAPLISDCYDYLFPRDYIYDAEAHCTSAGAEYRTNLLFNNIKPYI